eukprot:m.218098 g.218098  ORF g.218098 m.218098 type:complete len:590 (+) comp15899_c0_seq2:70-1839(+)
MAEAVRAQLEEQLDELHDLVKARLFTQEEIKLIIKRRRAFEYALRRRQTRKIDYLRYIQYELNVEELRKERKQNMKLYNNSKTSEFSIIRRIHFIFKRGLLKFKHDIRLWLQYFTFCEKTGAARSLAKAYAQALQYHPLNEGLWVKAAAFEWEQDNTVAARTLFQRGLRLLPTSRMLWKQYLKLETMVLEKTILRRTALGLPPTTRTEKEIKELEQRQITATRKRKKTRVFAASESDDDEEDSSSNESETEDKFGIELEEMDVEKNTSEDLVLDPFLRGDILQVVYSGARERVEAVDFALELIDVLRQYEHTKVIRDFAYDDLGDSVEALQAKCRRPLDDVSDTEKTFLDVANVRETVKQNFSKALKEHDSTLLWEAYIEFLMDCYDSTEAAEGCQAAHKKQHATPKIFSTWMDIVQVQGNMAEALRLASLAITSLRDKFDIYENNMQELHLRHLTLVMMMKPDRYEPVFQETMASSSCVEGKNVSFFKHRLGFYIATKESDRIHEAYQDLIREADLNAWKIGTNEDGTYRAAYVQWVCLSQGIAAARRTYKKLLRESPVQITWATMQHFVSLELEQVINCLCFVSIQH